MLLANNVVKSLTGFKLYSQVHNKQGVKINGGGGFKDFEKLLNGGVKISGGVGTKYKRKETKIGLSLSTSLTSLNIGISSILRSRLQ